jgi:thiamine-monophosphate kinase
MPGEFDLIDWIRRQPAGGSMVLVPPGDDLAVIKWPADLLLVGVDQALDGVHFDSAVHSPTAIGRKVMNRNLSDCAAMACLPVAAVATVALPRGTTLSYARKLYTGMREAAGACSCAIVGGDTATWDGRLALTVSILGRAGGIQPIRRQGARAGDGIYVSGPLGGSLLGRHMTFTPRIELARELGASGRVTAMIDLSDGLSRDLGHICRESGVGAQIDARLIPIHKDALRLAQQTGRRALDHALHDGEDYELLFAARGAEFPGCTRIGRFTRQRSIHLIDGRQRRTLVPRGWEHRF